MEIQPGLWITQRIAMGRTPFTARWPALHGPCHRAETGYFHCVETPNPAAMKPKPTTMFQLPSDSTGSELLVT